MNSCRALFLTPLLALVLSACGQLNPDLAPQAALKRTHLGGVTGTLDFDEASGTGTFTLRATLRSSGRGVPGKPVAFAFLIPDVLMSGGSEGGLPLGEATTDRRGVATLVLPFSFGSGSVNLTSLDREAGRNTLHAAFPGFETGLPPELLLYAFLFDFQVAAGFEGDGSYAPAYVTGNLQGPGLFGGDYYTADFEGLRPDRVLWDIGVGRGVSGPYHPDRIRITGKRRTARGPGAGNVATVVSRGGNELLTAARAKHSRVPNPTGGLVKIKFNKTFNGGTVFVTRLTVHDVTREGGSITLYEGGNFLDKVPLPVTGKGKSATIHLLTPASFVQVSAPSAFAVDDVRFQTVDPACGCGLPPGGIGVIGPILPPVLGLE